MLDTTEILASRILIVDDQEANVKLLERVLREAGYTAVASTMVSREVPLLYSTHRHDLILLDLQMPGMDGFELMALLKLDSGGDYLPIIVLTAQPAHKLRALQAGARDFISKPFDLVEVKTRIRNMLEVRLLYKRIAADNERLERAVAQRTEALAHSEARFRRFTELASDWYWEQNESGSFTEISGPVVETLGIGMSAFLGGAGGGEVLEIDDTERVQLRRMITLRQPFLDFAFSRLDGSGVQHHFRVSGEPMFDASCRFTGYRGIGVEVAAARP